MLRRDPRSAAERAAKIGDWLTAAEQYVLAGEAYRAIECYERARAFDRGIEVALEVGREEMAARLYVKAGDPHRAATLLRSIGHDLEAAEAFLQAGFVLDAAGAFADAGALERAADLYEGEGLNEQAANLLDEAGELERAGELFAKAGQFSRAAASFEKAGDFVRAAEIHERSGRIREAARSFGKAGEYLRAARLFEHRVQELKTGPQYLPPAQQEELDYVAKGAAHFFDKANEYRSAIEVLERAEQFEGAAERAAGMEGYARAAELYSSARQVAKAAEMFRRSGDEKKASQLEAEHFLDKGQNEEAAEALARAGDMSRAAELFDSLERFERACDCYEILEAWPRAAEAAARAGLTSRAASAFEKAKNPGRAAGHLVELGEFGRAARLFAEAERFYEAAQTAAEANLEREMLQYLQRVPEDDGHYRDAVAILASAFIRRGWSSIAIENLKTVLATETMGPETLDLWLPLAEALEDVGELVKAEELLRRMMSISYNYRDIDLRHTRLVRKIEQERERERYEIGELLGKGGMGRVYRAFDRLLGRPVAYKVLSDRLARDTSARDDLLQEARAAAALNHPNIITVYDLGVQHGRAFICMELVDGDSYAKLLRQRQRLTVPDVMHLVVSACQGLDHAHHRGIIHRDLKPSNILLTKETRVKILDFGLAEPAPSDGDESSSSSFGGTPKYIAPEQARCEPSDARSDIYSFGATLFELLSGRPVFAEGEMMEHHKHTPAPPLKPLVPDIPDALEELVLHCLAKAPSERFQSAGELLAFAQAAGLV